MNTASTVNTARTLAATGFAALLLAFPALAQTAPAPATAPPAATAPAPPTAPAVKKAPNPNNGHGRITAVSATSLTVQPKGGEAKTFAITPQTKFLLDGQPATASALAVGLRANVGSKDGVTARRIVVRTKKAKAAAAVNGAPAPKFHGFRPAATL